MLLTVISRTADILGDPCKPCTITKNDSQLLYGEQFQVEESRGAYVYGYSVVDGYQGSVEREQLIKDAPEANKIVKTATTHIYRYANLKSRPLMPISFLSRLITTENRQDGFIQLHDESWVFEDHIADLNGFKMPDDLAQTATIYLGTPYLYGGRSAFGIDCSALVQQTMFACGYECPKRDCIDQQGSFGTAVSKDDIQRNDIVYFNGHVGIMMDDKYILNATARHMITVIEELQALEEAYGDITHIARLP